MKRLTRRLEGVVKTWLINTPGVALFNEKTLPVVPLPMVAAGDVEIIGGLLNNPPGRSSGYRQLKIPLPANVAAGADLAKLRFESWIL